MTGETADLRRTPLYEQHAELGAKLVPFAGWEMPVTYEGVLEEHSAVRTHVGMFDVSHMGEIEVEGPGALAFLQRALSNDVARIEVGGAQYSCLCAEDGGVIDDLFVYRLGGDRYLIVANAANHEADLAWLGQLGHGFDVAVRDVAERYAMLAVQGPHARSVLGAALKLALPPRLRVATAHVGRRPALVCGTGYTGEDGVELLIDPEVAVPIWKELLDAGVVPCGLGARDTLRLEVCYPLHGNELGRERDPIEAGLGWCCVEATGFVGAEAVARARAEGTAQRLAPFLIEGPGIPRQGNPVLAGAEEVGVVTSGTFSPSLEVGAGMAYVRADLAEAGTELVIDVRGKARAARVGSKPLYSKKELILAEATYPDDLRYHDQHDWAQIEGEEALFGITWFAQDSLGEVVFYDPPEVGDSVQKDQPYAEVESVKAVSDVIAPLSGEVLAVNEDLGDAPERINEDPYGEGWLIRVKLTSPEEAETLLGAAEYRKLLDK